MSVTVTKAKAALRALPRRGRGRARKTIAILAACHRILEEIQPASVRAVCYRLFTEGLIENMGKSCTNGVSRLLTLAREEGEIPWSWIVDETREAEAVSTWDNPEQIISAAVRGYRKNYWNDQPQWVEVWSEKGTVRGTLAPVLQKYGITFRVMHGYGSATALQEIAQQTQQSSKWLTALYVGDWDPSGLHMSEVDLPARLERYGAEVTVERIALSRRDIRHRGLPHFQADTKAKDPRYSWYRQRYGGKCWELDALSPVVLRQRVDDEILSRLDVDAWNRAVQVEEVERRSMEQVLGTWRSSISGQAQK